ncbi:tRNA methyltransferase, has a role in tRNA modification [Xylographa trunciseda]|nr:tRNA methyltransferase, has a role in tRNA modification [Xylographa trunciseda]
MKKLCMPDVVAGPNLISLARRCALVDPSKAMPKLALLGPEAAMADVDHCDVEPYQPNAYEALHVHDVYNQIASHFSSTRYKPWPIVEQFLRALPDGSVGIDVGCGNGKYLGVNPGIFIVASDRSENLVKIASQNGQRSALIADSLSLPHRNSSLDFAICIAVVHHLSTALRRVEALRSILRTLRCTSPPSCPSPEFTADGGKALIYVWALEQRNSRRGWDEGDEQDVMVPWVMKGNRFDGKEEVQTFHRYYHLYRQGELERDIIEAGGFVIESGYEKDNWWAVAACPRSEII